MYDPQRFKEYFEGAFTYEAGFRRNIRRYGNDSAILDPETGRNWTYAELDADVARTASALAEAGVGRGDAVVYQLPNCPEFAILYLATQRIAAVSVPINYRLSAGETSHILDDSSPKVFVYTGKYQQTAEHAVELAADTPTEWVLDGRTGENVVDFWNAVETAPDDHPHVPEDSS